MGSLRKVALPKTTMRIPKFRETVQEDDNCKRWWIKALELASGLKGEKISERWFEPGHTPAKTARVGSGLSITTWFGHYYGNDRLVEEGGTKMKWDSPRDQIAVWDEFTEEACCRLLDIFQNLDCGERTEGVFEVSGNQFDYTMYKRFPFQKPAGPCESSGFSIYSDIADSEIQIPLVHLRATWRIGLIDAAKLCFAELFEHLGIELE